VAATIRVDAIGISVADGDVANGDMLTVEQADVVVRRVLDDQVLDHHVTALLEGDRLRAAARSTVTIDPAWTHDGEVLHAAALKQGEVEVRRFAVGKGIVLELLVAIEIGIVPACDERGVSRELQDETIPQPQRAGKIVPGREEHDVARLGGSDGGLNGCSVAALAIAASAVVANAPPGGTAPGRERP
jgi:hypothetical protein